MPRDYLLGLATLPAVGAVVLATALIWRFVVHRVQRLKAANVSRRSALAARLFASKRAYVWRNTHFALAATVGHDWPTQDRAEAALLDEFDPRTEVADVSG